MRRFLYALEALLLLTWLFSTAPFASAQSGTSGTIAGTVADPSGAVVANATVTIHNPVSEYERTATTDASGKFTFSNVPYNPYHLTISAKGFAEHAQDVDVRSPVPVTLKTTLSVAGAATQVTVESGGDLLENEPTAHTDVDRGLFDKLPLESASSSVSSLVTLAVPGIAADSNGLFHGFGDHAENSFYVDGQPITDQQSKVFSNQIPLGAVQSLEVIQGAPPAEYGDKTSLVINVTTRSGQGVTTPHGSVTGSYGSFGTPGAGLDLLYGGQKWGNYISIDGLNSGRFLDPPEFVVMHDKGNEENFFDRVDYQLSSADSAHLDLNFTRSWFQNPNSFDAQYASAWYGLVADNGGLGPDGQPVGPADQRSRILTFNIAPTWTHLINADTVLTAAAWVRHDQYNYYPSNDPLADLSPDLQSETAGQLRFLTNAGARAAVSYVKGINDIKAGVDYEQTSLTEHDTFGIVDPTFLSNFGCPDGNPPPDPCAVLPAIDLTTGGSPYEYRGHTDVKELALYAEDAITKGSWSLNLGLRGDVYNGLATASQVEPRLGIAYNIKPTNTVLRVSYARTLETPFNENLVLSSVGCTNPIAGALFFAAGEGCADAAGNLDNTPSIIPPGYRNEFHAGLQQAFGHYLVVDGEYIWKYTHNAYDFSILGATPITFPIAWNNSKIPGFALRATVPNVHGFTAQVVMSSVAARFFEPQVGGVGATPGGAGGVFRIDHDEKFNETTHLQYEPWKVGPWFGFNWRYDSGLVAGAVPFSDGGPVDLSGLSPDQQFQAGLFCTSSIGTSRATPPSAANPTGTPIMSDLGVNICPAAAYGSTLISIPAPGTEDDDHNPQRIAARNLFDIAVGDDNLFRGDRYQWSLRVTAINVTNKVALYNFISTFSGTHYVTPRSVTAELGFHF
jgi:Carboxypeptidase regulatory-like domain/TonB-dependent Receptor Plug Domain